MSKPTTARTLRRFLPHIEQLEERFVPAFVWPTAIDWPDLGTQGTQTERTSLRRDYTQRSEAGATSYTVTVSAAIGWDSDWSVADGKVESTNKVGWFKAKLSKFEGEDLVDFETKSGALVTGTNVDTLLSLVVSVGTTGAGLDLFGFSVVQPGATRTSFEDSYLGYTVGIYNTAALNYHFGGGTSAMSKIVTTTQPPASSGEPPSGVVTTTTEQQFDSAYWASSAQWHASRKGRLAVDSGASSLFTGKHINSPWVVNGVESGRNQVVDNKYAGNSWNKSSSYLPYGDPQSTAPNRTSGWVATQHDETSETTGSYACDFNLVLDTTWVIDSGNSVSKGETKTTVALDKVESRDEFFVTVTSPSADPSTSEKTVSGFTTAATTLTNGQSTITTNGTVTFAGREAVCDDWSIETATSGVQEIKNTSLTKYRDVWGNPFWTNPTGVSELTIASDSFWREEASEKATFHFDLVGKITQYHHERQSVASVSLSETGVGSHATRVTAGEPSWAVLRSETETSRAGKITENRTTDGPLFHDGKSSLHVVGSMSSKFTGNDAYVTTSTHPSRPTRTESGTTTIRRDESALEMDIWVVDGKTDTGTLKYVTDQEGKKTTAVRVDGEFKSSNGTLLGREFLEYDWWSDATVGHREQTASYKAGVATELTTVADNYAGGFTVRGWGNYSESALAWESWEQNGHGSFSGKANGNWTRVDGNLTAGSMSVSVGDHRDMTNEAKSKRSWDTTTAGVNSKGLVVADQKVRNISDQEGSYHLGVVGGVWVENGREFDLAQSVSVHESVDSKETKYEPDSVYTKTVTATGYRYDGYRAKGNAQSSTFSKTHQDKSARTETATTEYSFASGDSGNSKVVVTGTTRNDRSSNWTITGGTVSIEHFLTESEGTNFRHVTSTHATPQGKREVETKYNETYGFRRSGSPASGVSS